LVIYHAMLSSLIKRTKKYNKLVVLVKKRQKKKSKLPFLRAFLIGVKKVVKKEKQVHNFG